MQINIAYREQPDFDIRAILLEIAQKLMIERCCMVTISCTFTVSDGMNMKTIDRSDCLKWSEILWINSIGEILFEPDEVNVRYILGEAYKDAIKHLDITEDNRAISVIQFHLHYEK